MTRLASCRVLPPAAHISVDRTSLDIFFRVFFSFLPARSEPYPRLDPSIGPFVSSRLGPVYARLIPPVLQCLFFPPPQSGLLFQCRSAYTSECISSLPCTPAQGCVLPSFAFLLLPQREVPMFHNDPLFGEPLKPRDDVIFRLFLRRRPRPRGLQGRKSFPIWCGPPGPPSFFVLLKWKTSRPPLVWPLFSYFWSPRSGFFLSLRSLFLLIVSCPRSSVFFLPPSSIYFQPPHSAPLSPFLRPWPQPGFPFPFSAWRRRLLQSYRSVSFFYRSDRCRFDCIGGSLIFSSAVDAPYPEASAVDHSCIPPSDTFRWIRLCGMPPYDEESFVSSWFEVCPSFFCEG